MGYGSYRASDWAKLKNSRGISSSSDAEQIFQNNELSEKYDPRFIDMRESRDSDDSPESTPIIIGFDVTGSMGYLAAEIAKNSLNRTVTEIYDKQPVTNPHIMCAAFTSPGAMGGLQVTQFEADIRIVEQLLELKVRFGGNQYSYDPLVWYFAAKHTAIDSYSKRGKKGFIFCIGDEVCWTNPTMKFTSDEIKYTFGDNVPMGAGFAKLLETAEEKYHVFHITTGSRIEKSDQTWRKFMPGRTAVLPSEKINNLSEVIISIMQLVKGMDRDAVLGQWEGDTRDVVAAAIKGIDSDRLRPDHSDHSLKSVLDRIFGE